MELADSLREIADGMGCAGFGVTDAAPFSEVGRDLEARRSDGLTGKLQFTYKDPETATDIRRSFPWAQSIVAVSWAYMPEAGNPEAISGVTGRIARFATTDHYDGLRRALAAISASLVDSGWRAEPIVDDDRLVDRAAAVRAGVGWWGKSSMVLDPRNGPWLLLGSVITDATIPPTKPMERGCGTCTACLPACPTGAFVSPGVLDPDRCLAHWTQMGGTIPRGLRAPLGDRVYGCDACLDVCPPGFKQMASDERDVGRVDLLALLGTDDETLVERYAHFYLPRRRGRSLRRNALIALGNVVAEAIASGAIQDAEVDRIVGDLAGYLGDPDETYRIHAAWALGRIGVPAAGVLLHYQLERERSSVVASEIRATIDEFLGATQ